MNSEPQYQYRNFFLSHMLNFIIFFTVTGSFWIHGQIRKFDTEYFQFKCISLSLQKKRISLSIVSKSHTALDHFPQEFFSILPISQSIGCSYKHDSLFFSRDFLLCSSSKMFPEEEESFWSIYSPSTAFMMTNMHPMLWMIKKQLHSDLLFSFKIFAVF